MALFLYIFELRSILLNNYNYIRLRFLLLTGLALFVFQPAKGTPLKEGFKALGIYDYFLAKKCFYKVLKKKKDAYACYGLATIYSRHDNPFFNYDSASKYATLSYCYFLERPVKQRISGFVMDSASLTALVDTIAFKQLQRVKQSNNTDDFEHFLSVNYLTLGLFLEQAIYKRDELEFNRVLSLNQSGVTEEFIRTHAQSSFYREAILLKQRQVYNEQTKNGKEAEFREFIKGYPQSIMLNSAYESLYNIYRARSDVNGLKNFVINYPLAPQRMEAWKLLFSLTVKSFSNSELEKFLVEYPSFPFKESILKELELNKLLLFPYQSNDLYGFIDTLGKLRINNEYDAVSSFSEGLAVVSRNDSVFYINKENTNAFGQFYADAYPFKNGIAAVKAGKQWGFINRQGQPIPGVYDEINELSDETYVVKINEKYGAVNQSGQQVMEARFQKLGDFKNGFAYYSEDGKYGFVSREGFIHKAVFDWISDFNEYNTAIIRQDNLFGLINSQGIILLEASMDQIIKATKNYFIVVKNGQYGFYDASGCFVTQVAFDYLKEKPAEFYTNGNVFKLLRKNEQALVDANGRISIDFGTYDEVNFASGGLIRVRKKNKYGYVDRKLSLTIPYKYQHAGDFEDSVAVVELNGRFLLINPQGKEIFSSEQGIKKISKHCYALGDENMTIINRFGEKIWSGVEDIQKVREDLLIIRLPGKEVKILHD